MSDLPELNLELVRRSEALHLSSQYLARKSRMLKARADELCRYSAQLASERHMPSGDALQWGDWDD